MGHDHVYVISRRAWQIDDLDFGTFEPIFITLKEQVAKSIFQNLCNSVLNDKDITYFDDTEIDLFSYRRKNWCYECKIKKYKLDTFQAVFSKDKK